MSPEDFFCHGTLKSEIAGVLYLLIKQGRLGHLVIDATRVSSPEADLSCEPDIVFVSQQSIDAGRVRLMPKAGGLPGRYVEIEGAPDLIVEVVSDTSVEKDTRRLPPAYFRAGVREFWLADARGQRPTLVVHHRGPSAFVPADRDPDGFQPSLVFARRFRLDSTWEQPGNWAFDLRGTEAVGWDESSESHPTTTTARDQRHNLHHGLFAQRSSQRTGCGCSRALPIAGKAISLQPMTPVCTSSAGETCVGNALDPRGRSDRRARTCRPGNHNRAAMLRTSPGRRPPKCRPKSTGVSAVRAHSFRSPVRNAIALPTPPAQEHPRGD